MEDYGSALLPDFRQYYGLSLVEVVTSWDPLEVLLLINGLPLSSRYAARVVGEPHGAGWDRTDWLALDTRNAVEALRATVVGIASGKKGKKDTFSRWDSYPGRDAMEKLKQRKRVARNVSKLEQMAQDIRE